MRKKYIKRSIYRRKFKNKRVLLVSNKRSFLIEAKKFHNILANLDYNKRVLVANKAMRFMNIDIKEEEKIKASGHYSTQYKKFEFVHCHFTGIGFEWDFPHFALIWDIDPYLESVLVIPTTSVQRDDYIDVFSVGQIQGLPKGKTSLLISDMTRVSRKRLEKIEYTHVKFGVTNPKLPKVWEDRIHQGIISRTLQLPSFETIISRDCGLYMVDSLNKYDNLKFKSIIKSDFDKTINVLTYRIWDKDTYDSIQLIPPSSSIQIKLEHKRQKLKWLNSKEVVKRSLAKQFFFEIYGIKG